MAEESNVPIIASPERAAETLALLENWVQERIISFDKRRKFYRTGAYRFTLTTAGLSSVTTILIGINQTYNSTNISVISLIASASISFLSAWESLYGYRQKWIQNNDTLMKLYALNSDIQYQKARSGNKLTIEEIDKFYNQYQIILQVANEKWQEDRNQKKVIAKNEPDEFEDIRQLAQAKGYDSKEKILELIHQVKLEMLAEKGRTQKKEEQSSV